MVHLRKIFLKIFILLILLFIIDYAIGYGFNFIRDLALVKAPTKPITHNTLNRVNEQVLIMGNSRANHHYVPQILTDSLNLSVYNCGRDGQSFEYSVAMIHAVLKRYKPKLIIVDFEPTQFDSRNSKDFSISELYPYYHSDSLFRKIILHEDANHRYKMISKMYQNNSQLIDLIKLFFVNYDIINGYSPLANKGYKYPGLSKFEYDITATADNFKIEMLNYCIQMCKKNQVKLVFSISPRYQQSNMKEIISSKIVTDILKNNNIPLVDMRDNSAIQDSTMYKDAAHLNHSGAIEFTTLFVNVIKNVI